MSLPDEIGALESLVLSAVQSGFPVMERPFEEIARRLGLSERQVIDTVSNLTGRGVIRRFGAVFDSRRLGYVSTLVAVRIPEPESLPAAAEAIGRYSEVTHNYERDSRFNLWFTLIAEGQERIEAILSEVRALPGVAEVRNLPQEELYKIRAEFNPLGGGRAGAAEEE